MTLLDDSEMCVPDEEWKPAQACDCVGDGTRSDQPYPVSLSVPPACRPEWPESVVLHAPGAAPVYYQRGDSGAVLSPENGQEVLIKIDGEITFTWTGVENVHQADENWIPFSGDALETSIRSGEFERSGTFTNVFDEPGEYYFISEVHQEMRIKITVIDCVFRTVISGYSGSSPRAFAVAVSSQTPGDYTLQIADHASIGFVTVYAGQKVTIRAGTEGQLAAPAGQLAALDASIRVMPPSNGLSGGEALLEWVHVTGDVTVERGGILGADTSVLPDPVRAAGMLLPMVDPETQQLPMCLRDDPPSVIYTHSEDLDTDLMLTCSTINGVAAWRQIMTHEGESAHFSQQHSKELNSGSE
jgi:hypothetical protein